MLSLTSVSKKGGKATAAGAAVVASMTLTSNVNVLVLSGYALIAAVIVIV
jgi:hypothetical protein